MKPNSPEKATENDPRGPQIADFNAEMKSGSFEPGDLRDPQAAAEALAHWDELDPVALRLLTEDPLHRSRLRMLQSVDQWMQRSAHRADARVTAGTCPETDELYDFGRGPGFRQLAVAQRDVIERHVERCADCAGIVATLASPPPLPLEFEPLIERPLIDRPIDERIAPRNRAELIPPRRPVLARKRTSLDQLWKRWAPLAAAASVLVVAGLWFQSRRELAPLGFPDRPLLRGEAGGPLYFPRDRVLAADAKLAAAWPALARDLSFEIEPQTGAESYRVDIFRHDGGAFASGTPVTSLTSPTPSLALGAGTLEPGHYTWRGWALERGLERSLGERDFAIVDDTSLAHDLDSLAGLAEPERSLAAVRAFTERGFLTDARRLARALPPSTERDAFLGRMPGR